MRSSAGQRGGGGVGGFLRNTGGKPVVGMYDKLWMIRWEEKWISIWMDETMNERMKDNQDE